MKSLFGTLAVLMSVSAQASTLSADAILAATNADDCVASLKSLFMPYVNYTNKKDVIAAIERYQTLAGQIRDNVRLGQSNNIIIASINNELNANEKETFAGLPIGHAIVKCVRSQYSLNIHDKPEVQKATAIKAWNQLSQMKLEVKKAGK